MIKLQNVSKSFYDKKVIDNVSVTIAQGEVFVLLGPSGCGKTTLLRMICALESSDSGEISIAGTSVSQSTFKERAHNLGLVIQEGGLFNHMSALDNILLPIKILGFDQVKAKKTLQEYMDMVNLEFDILKKFPLELSGGQRQRVALLRALIHDPDILLMDEPMSALDPMVRSSLQKDLKKIFEHKKKTVVIVTHDLHEAYVLSNRAAILNAGKIEQMDIFSQIIKSPKTEFVQDFIQSQAMVLS